MSMGSRGFMRVVAPPRGNGVKAPVAQPVVVQPAEASVVLSPPTTSTVQLGGILQGTSDSWLRIALREAYADERPLWGEPRPVEKGWTPSSLGEPNDRLLMCGQYGYRGDPIDPELRLIFAKGDAIEDAWVRHLTKMGVLVSRGNWLPYAVPGQLILRGKIDIIATHKYEAGRQFIFEIKSINSRGFSQLPPVSLDPVENFMALMGMGGYIGERVQKYMCQLQAYLARMGFPEGYLLFDNKDTADYAEYALRLNQPFVDGMFARLEWLQDEFWSQGLVPPWNGGESRHTLALYKPTEAIPIEEIKALFPAEETF